MPATTPTINGKTALWGMDGAVFTGVITSFSKDDDSDEGEILDNNGYRIGSITYNQKSTFSLEILIESTTTLPSVGDLVTIDTIANCIVMTVGKAYGQKDWRKFKFTAKNFINLVPS